MTINSSDYDVLLPYLESFVWGTGKNQATSFTIQQTNPSQRWVFKQLAVENDNAASSSTTVALYLNNVLISPSTYMVPTPKGIGISAGGEPYLVLQMSDQLTVSVAGATAGDQIVVQGLYTQVLT